MKEKKRQKKPLKNSIRKFWQNRNVKEKKQKPSVNLPFQPNKRQKNTLRSILMSLLT